MGHVMDTETIRVLIADGHMVVCEGLRLYLNREGLEIVGMATSGLQALEMTLDLEPNVLLLDIQLPGLDGFQVLAAIKSTTPEINVIMLTSHAASEYLARAILLGASGLLSKADDPKHIPQAIRMAVAGDSIVNRDLLQAALNEYNNIPVIFSHEGEPGLPNLTNQETRIIKLVAAGLDNDMITKVLSVTRNTVKTHMKNIFEKLGVSNRTQAAIWAIRHGLAE